MFENENIYRIKEGSTEVTRRKTKTSWNDFMKKSSDKKAI
jgi:hypothetical protein